MYRSVVFLLLFIQITVIGTSCYDTKKTTYFNDINETVLTSNNEDNAEHIIQKNDQLSIHITSLNEEASKIYNTTNTFISTTSTAAGTRTESSGYLVNSDGHIQMPMLGNIKAEGLTKKKLGEYIAKILTDKKLLLEPIVDIRYLNYEVTIIGEVAHPTVITVPNEKISLIKALGVAGDITAFGKKNNVMLIRESGGNKIVKRLDLNSSTFLQSPYYYLQPNDVVYVEPNKNKEASISRNRMILPSILSGISVLVIVLDRITRK
jgi:polysaccharide biosynthesis/export protein